MEFIQNPNLPDADVALVAMSGTYPILTQSLYALGIEVIPIQPCMNLAGPVRDHTDMVLHHLGKNNLVIEKSQKKLISDFLKIGFTVIPSFHTAGNEYPNDVLINAARIGNKIIAKADTLDKCIMDYCLKHNLQIIDTNQGYAKCSTVIVDENSIITADQSISDAARKNGMDVLLINPGHIGIKDYNYGFLGGASGKIGKNQIAFTGNIELHPDYNRIKYFCSERNVDVISLASTPLTDIGGIIPIMQKSQVE